MKLAQPWRVTTIAPVALPMRIARSSGQPRRTPRRSTRSRTRRRRRARSAPRCETPGTSVRAPVGGRAWRRARPASAPARALVRVSSVAIAALHVVVVGRRRHFFLGADGERRLRDERAASTPRRPTASSTDPAGSRCRRRRCTPAARGALGRKERRRPRRLVAEAGAGHEHDAALGDRRPGHVVDRQLAVGAVCRDRRSAETCRAAGWS